MYVKDNDSFKKSTKFGNVKIQNLQASMASTTKKFNFSSENHC